MNQQDEVPPTLQSLSPYFSAKQIPTSLNTVPCQLETTSSLPIHFTNKVNTHTHKKKIWSFHKIGEIQRTLAMKQVSPEYACLQLLPLDINENSCSLYNEHYINYLPVERLCYGVALSVSIIKEKSKRLKLILTFQNRLAYNCMVLPLHSTYFFPSQFSTEAGVGEKSHYQYSGLWKTI